MIMPYMNSSDKLSNSETAPHNELFHTFLHIATKNIVNRNGLTVTLLVWADSLCNGYNSYIVSHAP